jgi:aryl-alcohol dehydrogenase-like predicted oxidoreductase
MKYRELGRTGLKISEIGYGAWGIGGKQWLGNEDQESLKALRRAFELGLNFIDTALAYGDGHSEKLVGAAVKQAGQPIYVATKIPPKNRVWPASAETPIEDVFPYDYIIDSTDESLRNLNLGQIDLQQFHVWTDAWTETEDWRRAIEDLKKTGKVRCMGISVSEHAPDTALEALKTGLVDAVQVIYNVFDQTPEKNLFPLCQEMNLGVLARVPLDEGGLTGTITPETQFEPSDFRAHYFRGDRKQQIVEHVASLERDLRGVPGSLPEIALRFCLSHPAVTTVIPGMRRIKTVESSCAVSDAGPLPENVLQILRRHAWDRNFYE